MDGTDETDLDPEMQSDIAAMDDEALMEHLDTDPESPRGRLLAAAIERRGLS
jgi:hypothetical protein